MPAINPEILKWARETAGLDLSDASTKLGISDAYGLSAEERLQRLERGEDTPSRPLLLRMSKQYRRPLLVFYMSDPPRKANRGTDFRTLPDEYNTEYDALVDTLIRKVQVRQGIIKAALELEDEAPALDFIGAYDVGIGVETIIESIQRVIKFDLQSFRKQPSPHEAFAWLRKQVENVGIFVLLVGDLGSHHTTIPPEVFRGFAMADQIAPFVVINDKDSRAAWSFTLIHELAHIWLGQTGVSNTIAETAIEKFCNRVASEMLLPIEDLNQLDISSARNFEDLQQLISDFSFGRNLSSSMVAYNLFLSNKIDYPIWLQLSKGYSELWYQARDEKREKNRGKESGPNYYVVRRHRLGDGLISLVQRFIATGILSTTKAAKVLDVKAVNISRLFDAGAIGSGKS